MDEALSDFLGWKWHPSRYPESKVKRPAWFSFNRPYKPILLKNAPSNNVDGAFQSLARYTLVVLTR